jgi:hypothetical protein
MFEENELLTETFVAHTNLVPDTEDVLAKVDAIARTHKRNRWVLRASGVSLVSAGLVFGAIGVSGLASNGSHHGAKGAVLNSLGTGTAKTAATGTYTNDEDMTAFFDAGYDYNDAQKLAQAWNETNVDINQVKAEAGGKLLAGDTLPVPPSGQPVSPENKAVELFFSDGYGYNDAVKLAGIWHVSSYQAKIKGGQELENGQTLPVPPSGNGQVTGTAHVTHLSAARAAALKKLMISKGKAVIVPNGATVGSSSTDETESPADAAYFAAGYDYNNAVELGKIWNQTDITQIKAEAGQKLLDGQTLPVKPDNTPAPPDSPANDQAVNTFFNAGYDYNDAVKLGKIWNVSSYHAKIEGGKKLEAGQTLPVQPSS